VLWDSIHLRLETESGLNWLREKEDVEPVRADDIETLSADQLTPPSDDDGFFTNDATVDGDAAIAVASGNDDDEVVDDTTDTFLDSGWEPSETDVLDENDNHESLLPVDG
jgi:hypothetical protein